MAVTLVEHGEWLARAGRAGDAKPLFEEAGEVFERLQAKPWLERLGQTAGAASALGGQR
jgi:hypothetical protein